MALEPERFLHDTISTQFSVSIVYVLVEYESKVQITSTLPELDAVSAALGLMPFAV